MDHGYAATVRNIFSDGADGIAPIGTKTAFRSFRMSGLSGLLPYGDEDEEESQPGQSNASSVKPPPESVVPLPTKMMSIAVQSAPVVQYKVIV